jgi:hypothetical protein
MEKIKLRLLPNEWQRLNGVLIEIVEQRHTISPLVDWVLMELWYKSFARRNANFPPKKISISIAEAIALLEANLISPHHNLEQKILPYVKL